MWVTDSSHGRGLAQHDRSVYFELNTRQTGGYFSTGGHARLFQIQEVRWSEHLSGFNYIICYHAGRLGTKSDALTRRGDVYPKGRMVLTH
jgi:hypothetical protein